MFEGIMAAGVHTSEVEKPQIQIIGLWLVEINISTNHRPKIWLVISALRLSRIIPSTFNARP